MARPTEYDRTEIVDQALRAFWQRGVDGCSIQNLVDATGLKRQSLYNAFGDKDGLFAAVLERYQELINAELSVLDATDANLETLKQFFRISLQTQQQEGQGACLLVATAFGPYAADPKINFAITAGADALRRCITSFITRRQSAGEIDPSINPAATSAYLYSVLNGLSALARTGGSPTDIETSLEFAFKSLKSNEGLPQ